MATLGVMIGRGYVKGKGVGRVFTDLDSTEFLYFYPDRSDQRIYVARSKLKFRK